MTQPSRLLGGIAAATLAVVGVAFLGGCVFAVATVHGYQLSKTADYICAMFYVGAICAFAAIPSSVAAAITIGTPILLLWRRRGYNSILAYLLAGVLISVIVALVLTISRRVFSDFLWLDSASEPTGKRSFIRRSKSGVGPNDLGRPRPIGGVESEQAEIRSTENTARPIFRRINMGISLPQATNGCFVASISKG